MANRTIEDSKFEDSKIDFKQDNDENQLRKKIKLENDKIVSKIKEIDQDINISEHEIHKFLLIFHTLNISDQKHLIQSKIKKRLPEQ